MNTHTARHQPYTSVRNQSTDSDDSTGTKRRKTSHKARHAHFITDATDPLNHETAPSDSDDDDSAQSKSKTKPVLRGTTLFAILGYTRSLSKKNIPPIWLQWFKQRKEQQRTWIQWYRGQLRQRDPSAFDEGFDYPTFLTQDLAALQLTTDRQSLQWWRGVVGAQLRRSRTDIQRLQALQENEERFTNLAVTDATANERRGKAPPLIEDWHELVSFLRRVTLFTEDWVPHSYLHKHAHQLYQHLQSQSFVYKAEHGWVQRRAGQIIWYLKQIEMKEFGQPLGESDFRPDEEPPFFTLAADVDLPNFHQLLNSNYTFMDIPSSLLAPVPAPTQPRDSNDHRRSAPSMQPNTHDSRRVDTNRPSGKSKPKPQAKDPFPRALQTFWRAASDDLKRAPLSKLLQGGGSSTTDIITTLGLTGRHCCHLQVKGKCTHPKCHNLHDTSALVKDAAADKVVTILQKGAASMSLL